MKTHDFYRELETILELPSGSIVGTERLSDFPGWNSLAAIALIVMVDERLGYSVDATMLSKCESVADICRLVSSRLEDSR